MNAFATLAASPLAVTNGSGPGSPPVLPLSAGYIGVVLTPANGSNVITVVSQGPALTQEVYVPSVPSGAVNVYRGPAAAAAAQLGSFPGWAIVMLNSQTMTLQYR